MLDWLWPTASMSSASGPPVVADEGMLGPANLGHTTNVVVLRGPCSMGVLSLAEKRHMFEYLVLIREPWRPIGRRDVEFLLRTNVAVEIPFSQRVARLADAGLLAERALDLDEFSELRAWATRKWRPTPAG